MGLSMLGMVDHTFKSITGTRHFYVTQSGYVDGIWTPGTESTQDYDINVQNVTLRELDFPLEAGQRIVDLRKIYVNSGDTSAFDETDYWTFSGQTWKVMGMDNRPWRNYCKILVNRVDPQP